MVPFNMQAIIFNESSIPGGVCDDKHNSKKISCNHHWIQIDCSLDIIKNNTQAFFLD